MKTSFNSLISNEINSTRPIWQTELKRKVNLATWVSIINMFVATLFVHFMHFDAFFYECLITTLLLFVVIVVNRFNPLLAIYCYYILDFLFLIPVNLKMGLDSYVIVYFFPVMFTLIQMLGKKETLKR